LNISIHRDPVREHGWGSLSGDSEGKMNFQGMECGRFCRWVSLSIGVLLGNLKRGVHLKGNVRDSGRRAPEMKHHSLQELC